VLKRSELGVEDFTFIPSSPMPVYWVLEIGSLVASTHPSAIAIASIHPLAIGFSSALQQDSLPLC
jgi:hypothetical protein